jgi:hypothetical protein
MKFGQRGKNSILRIVLKLKMLLIIWRKIKQKALMVFPLNSISTAI